MVYTLTYVTDGALAVGKDCPGNGATNCDLGVLVHARWVYLGGLMGAILSATTGGRNAPRWSDEVFHGKSGEQRWTLERGRPPPDGCGVRACGRRSVAFRGASGREGGGRATGRAAESPQEPIGQELCQFCGPAVELGQN